MSIIQPIPFSDRSAIELMKWSTCINFMQYALFNFLFFIWPANILRDKKIVSYGKLSRSEYILWVMAFGTYNPDTCLVIVKAL